MVCNMPIDDTTVRPVGRTKPGGGILPTRYRGGSGSSPGTGCPKPARIQSIREGSPNRRACGCRSNPTHPARLQDPEHVIKRINSLEFGVNEVLCRCAIHRQDWDFMRV